MALFIVFGLLERPRSSRQRETETAHTFLLIEEVT
jgi:hypothetical protein